MFDDFEEELSLVLPVSQTQIKGRPQVVALTFETLVVSRAGLELATHRMSDSALDTYSHVLPDMPGRGVVMHFPH